MNAATLRTTLRWSHIVLGSFLGAYICSPLHLDPTATLVARWALVPLVALTGIAMWKQGKLQRLFAGGVRSDRPAALHSRVEG